MSLGKMVITRLFFQLEISFYTFSCTEFDEKLIPSDIVFLHSLVEKTLINKVKNDKRETPCMRQAFWNYQKIILKLCLADLHHYFDHAFQSGCRGCRPSWWLTRGAAGWASWTTVSTTCSLHHPTRQRWSRWRDSRIWSNCGTCWSPGTQTDWTCSNSPCPMR